RMLIGWTIGEFLRIELAKEDHAGRSQPGDSGGVLSGHEVCPKLRAGRGQQILGPIKVLMRNRVAMQRPASSAAKNLCLRCSRLFERDVCLQSDDGIDRGIAGFDPVDAGLGDLYRRNGAALDQIGQLCERSFVNLAHSRLDWPENQWRLA